MTFILSVAWFSVCFIFYGILLLLPTILSQNTSTSYNFKYVSLIVISLVEMFCFVFSKTVMDHPDMGRKKSTYIGFGCAAIFSLLLMMISEDQTYLLLGMFLVIKILITMTFMVSFCVLYFIDALSIFCGDLFDFNKRKGHGCIFFGGKDCDDSFGVHRS